MLLFLTIVERIFADW